MVLTVRESRRMPLRERRARAWRRYVRSERREWRQWRDGRLELELAMVASEDASR
jgi:hypothetical protein